MANSKEIPRLSWTRPATTEYPKIWHTFMARDTVSDNLVEYRIQDLPLNRVNELYDHMLANYILDEPVAQILGSAGDLAHFTDYKFCWDPIVAQRTVLVCFKAGSDEIVGANMIFVSSKDDHFMEKCRNHFDSKVTEDLFDLLFLLYENYDPYKKYNVDKYMASLGLSVDRKYRGRSIGDHFLSSRKAMCREFGLKFSGTIFTSDFSNANADKAGFRTDVSITYDDAIKKHPEFKHIAGIKSKRMTVKTLLVEQKM